MRANNSTSDAAVRSGLVVRLAVVLLIIATAGTFGAPRLASAHTPHDVAIDVELSPEFAQDQTVYAIVREYLLASHDGGDTWSRLVRGLDNRAQLRAVEVSAQDKQVLYVGSLGDGVFRSTDGGRSWRRTSGSLASPDVRSLSISPRSSDVLFATIEVDGVPAVVRTADGGQSWSPVPQAGEATVIEFATDDPAVVLSGSADGRVKVSRDGGSTWREVLDMPESGGITAIAAARSAPASESIFVATRNKGLLASTDGARSFTPVGAGITDASIVSVALSPQFMSDGALWVSTWTTGAFESEDAGATWVERAEGLTTNTQADQLGRSQFGPLRVAEGAVGADPTVYLAGFDGLFRSTGAGTWRELETQSSSNVTSMAISPTYGEDQTIAVATYLNGAFLSVDGGRTWRAINDGLAYERVWTRAEDYYARLISIGLSPSFASDRTLFASERGYVLRSETAGEHWSAQIPDGLLVKGEEPPDYTLWAFSPGYASDRTIILGSSRGKVFRSTDGGAGFAKVGELDAPVTAIATSPAFASDQTVIAGTPTGVQRSTDAGRTWERIGLAGGEVTSLAIAPDFAETGRIFVGTTTGLFVTDGTGWTPITGSGLGPAPPIEAVAVSPELPRDGIVLVSVRGRGLFRSVDGGASVNPIGTSLLEDDVVLGSFYHRATSAIRFSPDFEHDHTVFGTAETGVFKSTDGGETWERLVLPVSTHDTAVEASPSPLLPTIEYTDPPHASADDRSFATPLGRLSARRVLAAASGAVLTFVGLTVVRRRAIGNRRPFESRAVRAACSCAVLVAALLVLSA